MSDCASDRDALLNAIQIYLTCMGTRREDAAFLSLLRAKKNVMRRLEQQGHDWINRASVDDQLQPFLRQLGDQS